MTEYFDMSLGDAKREHYEGPPQCPECRSTDVEHTEKEKEMGFTRVEEEWYCLDCGYTWD